LRRTLFLCPHKSIVNQYVNCFLFGCNVWHTTCLIEGMVCNVTLYNFSTVLVVQARHSSMWDEKIDIFFSLYGGIGNGTCGAKHPVVSQRDIFLSFTTVCCSVGKASIVSGCIAYLSFSTTARLLGNVTVPYDQQKHLLARISMFAEDIVGASCFVLSCIATREG
jgi:hypothetical protein